MCTICYSPSCTLRRLLPLNRLLRAHSCDTLAGCIWTTRLRWNHKGTIGGPHVGFASLPVSCGKPRTISPLVWLQTQITNSPRYAAVVGGPHAGPAAHAQFDMCRAFCPSVVGSVFCRWTMGLRWTRSCRRRAARWRRCSAATWWTFCGLP